MLVAAAARGTGQAAGGRGTDRAWLAMRRKGDLIVADVVATEATGQGLILRERVRGAARM
ncbi:MAG: hypothetical protein Q4G22_05150 [Paracoccus sp. (in: a-proteobacteria)]|uniref:hypothetical protein n=1 Tax=Paracoccus sp. TaxID=267 RepID=UPI0026DEA242|nr:hypothetical protein [Paracoccus sp. (in: a-proteobacteria)]MDO5631208.1 hypothetical protein [Paracoccus sp. (in: a-proteobacteria)]